MQIVNFFFRIEDDSNNTNAGPGIPLLGRIVTYNLDTASTSSSSPSSPSSTTAPNDILSNSHHIKELEVTPITLYSSEYVYRSGNLITVNNYFICYIVKGELIRVLHKRSAARGLLKGHNTTITDLKFWKIHKNRKQTEGEQGREEGEGEVERETEITINLLISVDSNANIFIWKLIYNNSDVIEYPFIFFFVLL